jgi:sec-independent protein translocase protein TatB
MSGIAGSEVVLLIIIGLIVLGPKRLPQVANQIGGWLGQARRMTRMMKRQLEQEVNFDIHKEVGIDENGNPLPTNSSVSSPGYVHDRGSDNKIHNDAESTEDNADDVASVDEKPAPDLPDDYSPAHAADDMGTGVGDDSDYLDDDEPEPVAVAGSDDADTSAAAADTETAEPGKKETA